MRKSIYIAIAVSLSLLSQVNLNAAALESNDGYVEVVKYFYSQKISQTGTSNSRKKFLEELVPLAIEIGQKYNIPPSAIVSQAIYESRYGESYLAKVHKNYFGIKAAHNWDGPVARNVKANDGYSDYRKYPSLRASVEDYAKFLESNRRYRPAFRNNNNRCGITFVRVVLRSGYCPDSDYLSGIVRIMARHKLLTLDKLI